MSRKRYILRGSGEPEDLVIERGAGNWRIFLADRALQVQSVKLPDGRLSLLLEDGRQVSGRVVKMERAALVSTSRGARRISLASPIDDLAEDGKGASEASTAREAIRALMPGRVIDVAVGPGDRVEAGSLLLVLEAMKMQNEIRSEVSGVVSEVRVASGEAVEAGAPLLSIQSTS